MGLAETTVVETVSGGWPQALSEAVRLLPASSQRGQELSGCGGQKNATRGRGIAALVEI
jgi:hypothetical protein